MTNSRARTRRSGTPGMLRVPPVAAQASGALWERMGEPMVGAPWRTPREGLERQDGVVAAGPRPTPASQSRPGPPRLDRRRFTLWLGVRAASAVGRLAEMAC